MLYILVNGRPHPVTDAREWAAWFESADRTVQKTKIDDVQISTVFLGIDHNFWGSGPPLLYETMVFGGALDQEQERCPSHEEALRMHAAMVQRVVESNERRQ